jgi:hypothetical protein
MATMPRGTAAKQNPKRAKQDFDAQNLRLARAVIADPDNPGNVHLVEWAGLVISRIGVAN